MALHRDRVYQGWEAVCDGPGCTGWDAWKVADELAAASRARAAGWSVDISGRSLCPLCRPRRAYYASGGFAVAGGGGP